MGIAATWSHLRESVAAPWELAGMCRKAATWHSIADAAEMVAAQCHGGLTVVTPASGEATDEEEPVVLRSLIQLDGDVLLMIDRAWLVQQATQAPGGLERALARHQARISAAVEPLRQGFDTASRMMILAGRSRWSVLGVGGLSQGGALALAPSFSASSLSAWLGAAAGQLEVVLLQLLSVVLLAVFGGVRLVLRWWIRRRLRNRLDDLMQRLGP